MWAVCVRGSYDCACFTLCVRGGKLEAFLRLAHALGLHARSRFCQCFDACWLLAAGWIGLPWLQGRAGTGAVVCVCCTGSRTPCSHASVECMLWRNIGIQKRCSVCVFVCVCVLARYPRYFGLPYAPLELQLEQDGAVVLSQDAPPLPDATDHHLLVASPVAAVCLRDLAAATRFRFRSRCVAGERAQRWELPWSVETEVATMRGPRQSAGHHLPEVLQVRSTSVTLRVRNPGVWCVAPHVMFVRA